jgi:hypothetical protein
MPESPTIIAVPDRGSVNGPFLATGIVAWIEAGLTTTGLATRSMRKLE